MRPRDSGFKLPVKWFYVRRERKMGKIGNTNGKLNDEKSELPSLALHIANNPSLKINSRNTAVTVP
jgi:hypothetical protein